MEEELSLTKNVFFWMCINTVLARHMYRFLWLLNSPSWYLETLEFGREKGKHEQRNTLRGSRRKASRFLSLSPQLLGKPLDNASASLTIAGEDPPFSLQKTKAVRHHSSSSVFLYGNVRGNITSRENLIISGFITNKFKMHCHKVVHFVKSFQFKHCKDWISEIDIQQDIFCNARKRFAEKLSD